ncbi:YtxH domain-containing protein [Spirochaetota bacterium]
MKTVYFILGAVIGAAAALVFAPKSGKEIRKDLRKYFDEAEKDIEKYINEKKDEVEGYVRDSMVSLKDKEGKASGEKKTKPRKA